MFTRRAIIGYWILAAVLAVTTIVLGTLAGYHADDVAGAPDGSIPPNDVLLGSVWPTAGLTVLAVLWAVTAMVLGAVTTRQRERAAGTGS
ncbi:hypothetical protein [Agromyces sp. SYSU T00266]|uniref:hypothetical protein n=1 Tax=Agromyces zhanjiangensis TaxID=3158562 RepID=UPI00339A794A